MEVMEKLSDFKNKIICALKREKDEYKRMSAAQKRVAIAKDVIAQINCEAYQPTAGTYVSLAPSDKAKSDGKSLQDLWNKPTDQMLDEGMLQCSVCAKGAMFMSHIRKDSDSCKVGQAQDGQHEPNIEERLTDVFSEKQLDLIEAAFEQSGSYYANNHAETSEKYSEDKGEYYTGRAGKAEKFGERYSEDQERLVGIMRNIIRNDGTFVPK